MFIHYQEGFYVQGVQEILPPVMYI